MKDDDIEIISAQDDDIEAEEVGDEESFKDRLKKIKEELKICKKEKEEYLAGWQRAKADFINYKKDEEKQREEFAKFAAKNLLYDCLSALDSIDMALKHGGGDGIKEIKNQFLEILHRQGVTEINAEKGTKFNPEEHESIAEENLEDENLDSLIIDELQKGYKLFNRVLRPSKVKVGVYKPVR